MLQNRATLKEIRFYLLGELRQIYAENESESICRMILEHTGYSISHMLRDPDLIPSPKELAEINRIVTEIRSGSPIQYILGYTYFCDLKIEVNNNVLIPRPETEEMVEHIKGNSSRSLHRIIDLGTGSGCIALALKLHFPDVEVWGIDISRDALAMAARNGAENTLQVKWRTLDLLKGEANEPAVNFDLVVSNPPYVMKSEQKFMDRNVLGFEPETSLFVEDDDPLLFYRAIASFCSRHLTEMGELWVEINERFGKETANLFKKEGFSSVTILKDIHEKERYIHARK